MMICASGTMELKTDAEHEQVGQSLYGGYNLHSTSNLHSTEACIQSSCNTVLWFNLHFTFENVNTFKSALTGNNLNVLYWIKIFTLLKLSQQN